MEGISNILIVLNSDRYGLLQQNKTVAVIVCMLLNAVRGYMKKINRVLWGRGGGLCGLKYHKQVCTGE